MPKNINQLTNSASSIQSLDKLYLGRSPYGITDDYYILGSVILSSFLQPSNNLSDVSNAVTAFNTISPITSKGDLISNDGTNDVRVPVGADTYLLTADSAQPSGLNWIAPRVPFSWTTVTGTSQNMAVNSGYVVANNAGLVTLPLPSIAAVGDEIEVIGLGAGGWLIAQNPGQQIILGSSLTTVGAGGSLASTNRYDNLIIKCVVANTTFAVSPAPQGNITVV